MFDPSRNCQETSHVFGSQLGEGYDTLLTEFQLEGLTTDVSIHYYYQRVNNYDECHWHLPLIDNFAV